MIYLFRLYERGSAINSRMTLLSPVKEQQKQAALAFRSVLGRSNLSTCSVSKFSKATEYENINSPFMAHSARMLLLPRLAIRNNVMSCARVDATGPRGGGGRLD